MAFPYLDAMVKALHDNAALHLLVDGNIFKFKSLEESEPSLGHSLHKSLISVELRSWPGSNLTAEPSPVIDIRCREGPEYCLEIAKAVKDILDDGISEVIDGATYAISVSSLAGDMAWDKTLKAWRLIYHVKGIIYTPATIISLTGVLVDPLTPSGRIIFYCECPEATTEEAIEYRFSCNGPGTGNTWQVMRNWGVQSFWIWSPRKSDAGSYGVKVEVRNASKGMKTADDSETITYVVPANALPVLTSITPSLASPQIVQTKVSFVAVASDADGDWILYRFWLKGPGTGGVWEDQTGWISRNRWEWTPKDVDAGANEIKVDIIDQKHEGRSSFDATLTINYTITANSVPYIDEVFVVPSSAPTVGSSIMVVCSAFDADNDQILYRFVVETPSVSDMLMTGWQSKNVFTWTPTTNDVGECTITVHIRDGKHAGPGGYDDWYETSITVSADSVPTITSLTPSLASPQVAEKVITFVCTASDANSDEILYKFWLSGPSTASTWRSMTGWQSSNYWVWNTSVADTGSNTIKVQVRDGKHAGPGGYDAVTTASYTINS